MTRSRLFAGVALLLLGVACGRLGAPVRASQARDSGGTAVPVPGGEDPSIPTEEKDEEKR